MILLHYVELLIYQHPKIVLKRAALSLFSIQPVFVLEIALAQAQNLVLDLIKLS